MGLCHPRLCISNYLGYINVPGQITTTLPFDLNIIINDNVPQIIPLEPISRQISLLLYKNINIHYFVQ